MPLSLAATFVTASSTSLPLALPFCTRNNPERNKFQNILIEINYKLVLDLAIQLPLPGK